MKNLDRQRQDFQRDGVVCIRGFFNDKWLDVVAEAISYGLAHPGPMYLDYSADTVPGSYCTDLWIWRENSAMREFIFESPAAARVGELMGVDSVMLVTDNWMVRRAGAVNRAPWHHDHPYFDVSAPWCVLWMGLEPVGPGESVIFIKGSHRWDRQFMPLSFSGSGPKGRLVPPYEPTPDFDAERDEHDFLEYSLEPGDCLIFDSRMVHGAPNPEPAENTVRRLTMRYAAGDARFEKRGSWTDAQCEFLKSQGCREGQPLAGDLLPILWQKVA